jgi:hypothetical protein
VGPTTRKHDVRETERFATGDPREVDSANAEALRRISEVRPFLVDVRPANEVAGLAQDEFLHAGPPLMGWSEACGPLRGSVIGALLHLKLARSVAEARAMAEDGAVRLVPANDHGGLATYAGVIGRQTPVLVVEDRASGRLTFAALNEGRGKALRYGAHDDETLAKLGWIEGEFAEILRQALRLAGGLDVLQLLTQAVHMGDDGHSRQKAASALLANTLGPYLFETGSKEAARALRFLTQNEIFFLPITMAAARNAMMAGEGITGSTLVTSFAANGARFGIKISSHPDAWFTAPVPTIEGRYFEGYGFGDASPVIGDSEIAECFGLGAFAMAAAPALAPYVGGTPEEAVRLAAGMYAITLGEHPHFRIPSLSYRGTAFGVDARRVVAERIEPVFNTGIAHREPGVGQIGAGLGRVPLACFESALGALRDGLPWEKEEGRKE